MCGVLAGGCAPQPPTSTATATPVATPTPTPEPEGLLKYFGKEEVSVLLLGDSKETSADVLERAEDELESMGVTAHVVYTPINEFEGYDRYDAVILHTTQDGALVVREITDAEIPLCVVGATAPGDDGASFVTPAEADIYTMLTDAAIDYDGYSTPVRMLGVFTAPESEAYAVFEDYTAQGKILPKQTVFLSELDVEIPNDADTNHPQDDDESAQDDDGDADSEENTDDDDADSEENADDGDADSDHEIRPAEAKRACPCD